MKGIALAGLFPQYPNQCKYIVLVSVSASYLLECLRVLTEMSTSYLLECLRVLTFVSART